jgi:FkbM family methyltransferase
MIKYLTKWMIKKVVMLLPYRVSAFAEKKFENKKLENVIRMMLNNGIKISNIYDIGAHKGDWTRHIQKILPNANIFMFEANKSNEYHLGALNNWHKITVLSDREKEVEFFATGGTGDSYFKENTAVYNSVQPLTIRTQKLDDVVNEENLSFPDFIKIDTQGSEIDILKGATACLKSSKIILLECPVYPYNKNAPSMEEYLTFMREAGFFPACAVESHILHGVFVQIDIIFVETSILAKLHHQFEPFYIDVCKEDGRGKADRS